MDIDVSGRHAPNNVAASSAREQACTTNAVLPTPASPETTSVCASPAAERSRSPLMVPSSRSRPMKMGADGSGGAATYPVWHRSGP